MAVPRIATRVVLEMAVMARLKGTTEIAREMVARVGEQFEASM